MTTLGPPFSCLNNNSREATFLWLNFPRKSTTQLTTRMENYYDKSLLWRYKEQSKVKPFKLSWATAGCDWQSHSVCDALYSQQTLKFAILWGPPPNDANRTWADTPTPQGSIFFVPWEDAKASIVITSLKTRGIFGAYTSYRLLSVCASVNMLQQMYCVCFYHRLLNNSYDWHTAKFYQWVILWVKKGKAIFILLWNPEQPLKLFSLKAWTCYVSSVISMVITVKRPLSWASGSVASSERMQRKFHAYRHARYTLSRETHLRLAILLFFHSGKET